MLSGVYAGIISASQAHARLGHLAGTCMGGDRVWVPAILETGTHKEAVRIVTPNLWRKPEPGETSHIMLYAKPRGAKSSEKTRIWGNFSYQ